MKDMIRNGGIREKLKIERIEEFVKQRVMEDRPTGQKNFESKNVGKKRRSISKDRIVPSKILKKTVIT